MYFPVTTMFKVRGNKNYELSIDSFDEKKNIITVGVVEIKQMTLELFKSNNRSIRCYCKLHNKTF